MTTAYATAYNTVSSTSYPVTAKGGALANSIKTLLKGYFIKSDGKIITPFDDARTSDLYVPDHEGVLHAIPGGTVAFEGARVARNLLDIEATNTIDSEDIGTWTAKLGGSTVSGDIITFGTTGKAGRLQTRIPEASYGITYTLAMELTGGIGQQVTLSLQDEYPPYPSTIRTVTLTSTKRIYSVTHTGTIASASRLLCAIYGTAGESVTVGRVWLSYGSVPSNYIHVSPGDGPKVEFYSTQNGNTVDANGVVTEAVGAPIITPIRMVHAPAATNYADGNNDLSGGPEIITLSSTGDYTLSVYGTAAVTVAAGTATGTGFAQATEGNPVTFNLTATGTVTLTLDSGALDTIGGAATKQVENNPFATPFIPTASASGTSRDTCNIRAPYAGAFNQSEGVVYIDWMPGYDSGFAINKGLVSTNNTTAGPLYLSGAGNVGSWDGSSYVGTATPFVANERQHRIVHWGSAGRQTSSRSYGNASWSPSMVKLYDGSFGESAYIRLFVGNPGMNYVYNLEILNKDIGLAAIEDRYSLAKVG